MFSREEIALAPKVDEAIKKIAEKAGKTWEWEPKRGEFAQIGMGMIVLVDRDGLFENKFVDTSNMGIIEINRLIPFLHWERIERILEGMGYETELNEFKATGSDYAYGIFGYDKNDKYHTAHGYGKTRQEAVQRAVIKFGKRDRHEKIESPTLF